MHVGTGKKGKYVKYGWSHKKQRSWTFFDKLSTSQKLQPIDRAAGNQYIFNLMTCNNREI